MKVSTPYPAPDFSLQDEKGETRTLADYKGKWLVLYFYPKDDMSGCTIEACGFRDANETLLAKRAVVVGISRDAATSHDAFASKYELPFTLLSDPERDTITAYGAWGKKMWPRRYSAKNLHYKPRRTSGEGVRSGYPDRPCIAGAG